MKSIDLHDGDKFLGILLSELTSPLGKGDVGLLQHNVGVPASEQQLITSSAVNMTFAQGTKSAIVPTSGQFP